MRFAIGPRPRPFIESISNIVAPCQRILTASLKWQQNLARCSILRPENDDEAKVHNANAGIASGLCCRFPLPDDFGL